MVGVGSLRSLNFKLSQSKACYTFCTDKDVKCHLKIDFALFVLPTRQAACPAHVSLVSNQKCQILSDSQQVLAQVCRNIYAN